MSIRPEPVAWIVEPRKITDYLLNADHIEGGAKARFFRRFGFETSSPNTLALSLLDHPNSETFVRTMVSARGDTKLVFEGPISAPDGRAPVLRTIWRLDESGAAHLVTAVPMTGRST